MEELKTGRENVQAYYRNPELNIDFRERMRKLLLVFDKEISKRETGCRVIGFPVHRQHGWYLSKDE